MGTFVAILTDTVIINRIEKDGEMVALFQEGKVTVNSGEPLFEKKNIVGVVGREGQDFIDHKYISIYAPIAKKSNADFLRPYLSPEGGRK